MLEISRDNRQEIENEFLALLLNKNELIDIAQVKPRYLYDKENAKIFAAIKECYEENKVINPAKILEKHKDVNLERMAWLLSNTFYYDNAWEEQLKLSEESIVKFFKEDIVNVLNLKLRSKEMGYDDFMRKMKELDDIELVKGSTTVTVEEINENINTDNVAIRLKNFEKLSNYLKIVQGDFIIIGAMTGQGKSGFMLNLMNDLMGRYQCIYFNMEMSKSTIYKRLVSINSDIPIKYINAPETDFQKKKIENSKSILEKAKLIVEHKANDIKQIKNVLVKYKAKEKHTILFIDHLGLTKADNAKSLYEQVTEVAKQLRQMCLEYDCTIISASQLNRGAYISDKPTLSQLKDSGELENSASKVILLYRDPQDKDERSYISRMRIDIVKNRDGVTGYVEMEYDKEKQVFKERKF